MISLILLLKGFAIGIAIAAPVGPVAVLCIRRTVFLGRPAGFASGLGAVTADLIFGAIAAFGVAAVSDLLLSHEQTLRGIGGLFLIGLGVRTWFRHPSQGGTADTARLVRSFASSFLLTITNPITIFAFTAIFAGFGVVGHDMTMGQTAIMIGGVAIGTVLWWCGLTLVADLFRSRIGETGYVWLQHLSGGLLVIFGLASAGSLLVV